MGIMVGIGTVLADDPMLNVRIPGKKSPVRIICDSSLRIPMDSGIVKSAKKYRTIVAYAGENAEKLEQLRNAGVETISVPDVHGQVDLKKLMEYLGEQGIDSILLEGGGTLNESALAAGIVNEVCAFIAPKIFGGTDAKTPVAGTGVAHPSEAVMLTLKDTEKIGDDLMLRYQVKMSDLHS